MFVILCVAPNTSKLSNTAIDKFFTNVSIDRDYVNCYIFYFFKLEIGLFIDNWC